MSSERPPLVEPRVRRVFRELAVGFVLRDIDGWWQDEGVAPAGTPNDESGARRSRFREYEDSIDWTDPASVKRAINVFETVWAQSEQSQRNYYADTLKRGGWEADSKGRLRQSSNLATPPASLNGLGDPSAILDAFARIEATIVESPRDAIGHAKELIESTARVVLAERGEPFDRGEDLPSLIARAQEVLGLRPTAKGPGPDSTQAIKRALGGLSAAAMGVNELRNLGYGSGHGGPTRPIGLAPRHAYLAVGAARIWCQMLLDTLADPDAPWRDLERK